MNGIQEPRISPAAADDLLLLAHITSFLFFSGNFAPLERSCFCFVGNLFTLHIQKTPFMQP